MVTGCHRITEPYSYPQYINRLSTYYTHTYPHSGPHNMSITSYTGGSQSPRINGHGRKSYDLFRIMSDNSGKIYERPIRIVGTGWGPGRPGGGARRRHGSRGGGPRRRPGGGRADLDAAHWLSVLPGLWAWSHKVSYVAFMLSDGLRTAGYGT